MGKGQQGLAAAREYLTGKDLADVLEDAIPATTTPRGALALVPAAGAVVGLPQALSRGRDALSSLPGAASRSSRSNARPRATWRRSVWATTSASSA